MDVISFKKLMFSLLCILLASCSSNIDSYNHALLAYEQKIELCSEKRKEPFTDSNIEIKDSGVIRLALSYFIIKTFEECVKDEKQILVKALNEVIDNQNVAELIQYHANNLLEDFLGDEDMLNKEHDKFLTLTPEIQQKLIKLQAYHRPFDPIMAIEHYLDEN